MPGPLTTYSAGTYELQAQTIHGPCFGFVVSYDVSAWSADAAVEVDFAVQVSEDDGATWTPGGGAGVRGTGPFPDRQGNASARCSFAAEALDLQYDANDKFVQFASIWRPRTALLAKVRMEVRNGTIQTDVGLDPVRAVNQQQNVPDRHHSIGIGVHASAAGDGSVSFIETAGITTTSGRAVVVDGCFYTGGVLSFTSITDNKSNSWASSVAEYANLGWATKVRQVHNDAIVGGSGHTFRETISGAGGFPAICASEISGADPTPLDKTHTGTVTSSSLSHSSGATAALAQAAELALGFGMVINAATGSVSAPWTQLENISNDGNHEGVITAYQIVSATTAVTFSWATGANSGSSSHVSTWKEATAVAPFAKNIIATQALKRAAFY